ncbi:MAG: endolytic transglycosylase MltG, partial [Firmicutes bacterium]|nr:endolytic transglycosylase MltG [Bacillota bacterium]
LRGGLMYFGFVICVSVILASVGWLAADDVLSLNKDYVEAEVYVGEQLDMKQVSAELYNKGLIKYPRLFRLFAKLMNAETKMDPGVYKLSSKLDYNAMVHAMHQSESNIEERATVTVMIPEGKTLKQTFQILADHGVCPYETLLECAANHEFKYDFLEDLPYGSDTRLEGYLFPDTYQFYAPSDPEDAIDKFLSNFNAKVNMEMRLQAGEMGYSLHEIITVASLVEMEAGKDAERPTIASVIYNRLNSSYYPYLQIDATIQYALEERKESLTNADLEIDSPYNTYKYTGLPPGPIANPGLASIRAALAPESTGYYFYALNKSGSHNFFATMDQFNYFVNSSEFGG